MNLNHNSHFFQFSSFLSLLSQENFFLRVFYFFDMLPFFWHACFVLLRSLHNHFTQFSLTLFNFDSLLSLLSHFILFGSILFTFDSLRSLLALFVSLQNSPFWDIFMLCFLSCRIMPFSPSSSPHFILSIHFYISLSIWWCEAHLVLSPV